MDSPATNDESRRLETRMAELRDLPHSAVFKKLPMEQQKRIASALRDLASKVGAMKPASVPTRDQRESRAAVREVRLEGQHRPESAVSQKAEFGVLLRQVDFPAFVGGLIKGTFNAIVDGSIQQMEAYSKLLSEVSKTIEDRCKPAGG